MGGLIGVWFACHIFLLAAVAGMSKMAEHEERKKKYDN